MKPLKMSAAALGLSVSLLPFFSGGALALDAETFGARLKGFMELQGVELGWSSISVDGDQVTLQGATAGATGEAEKIQLGDITLEEVTEEDGGTYRIGSMELPSYTHAEDDVEVTLDGLAISGLTLPPENATDPLASLAMYESFDIASAAVKVAGADTFKMSNLHVEVTPPEGQTPLEFTGSVESFSADLSQTEDPKAKEALAALGYETISGSVEMAGSWSPSDGRLTLEQNDFIVNNAGTLGVSFDLAGYTPEFAKAVQEMQKKMAENPDGDQSAQGIAMLGLMQQLTFRGATIRFDDDSLTGKVLDYMAKQQGVQRADIVNQAKAVLPFMLAQLNNPEFSAAVTAAIGKFLDDPQSLSITAAPAQPVPFAMLMAGAMTAPQTLPEQLGVTVTANEAAAE